MLSKYSPNSQLTDTLKYSQKILKSPEELQRKWGQIAERWICLKILHWVLKTKVKAEAECALEKMPSINSVNEDELHQEREQCKHNPSSVPCKDTGKDALGLGHHKHPGTLHFSSHHQHGSAPHLTAWSWVQTSSRSVGISHPRAKPACLMEQELPSTPLQKGRNYPPQNMINALAPDKLEK